MENARRAVFAAREAFVNTVRAELGRESVILPISRRQLESKNGSAGVVAQMQREHPHGTSSASTVLGQNRNRSD